MVDEEMARQYLIEKYGLRKDLEIERIQHSILSIEYSTYLAGLKAGEKLGLEKGVKAKVNTTAISDCPIKPMWHKVADGDLPEGEDAVLIYYKAGDISRYSVVEPYKVTEDTYIIAWCEIPKYTEE